MTPEVRPPARGRRRRRLVPDHFTGAKIERPQTWPSPFRRDDIRDARIDALVVSCEPELAAAERTAHANAALPHRGAPPCRIERVDHARLLSDDEKLAPVRKRPQDRRSADGKIRPQRRWTVRMLPPA